MDIRSSDHQCSCCSWPARVSGSYMNHVLLLSDSFLALSPQSTPISVFDPLNLRFLSLQKKSPPAQRITNSHWASRSRIIIYISGIFVLLLSKETNRECESRVISILHNWKWAWEIMPHASCLSTELKEEIKWGWGDGEYYTIFHSTCKSKPRQKIFFEELY